MREPRPVEAGPSDPGLQPERTELAWRRTSLAIAIGSLLSLRIFPLALPADAAAWGLLPGVVGVAGAGALWVAARRRQRHVTALLRASTSPDPAAAPSPAPGARMLLALTALTTAFGAVAITVVVASFVAGTGG